MLHRHLAALLLFLPTGIAACQSSPTGPAEPVAEFPGVEWRTATAQEAQLDPALLDAAVARITSGEIHDIDALLVVRHGRLVVERYFGESHRDHVHTMQSVSKSVTSLVVGAAIAQGRLRLDDRLLDVLPATYRSVASDDARKGRITIRDLLAMRSGINFHENPYAGSPLDRLNRSRGDWTLAALAEPMNADPGDRWQYNSGGVIALAAAVRAATGEPFHEVASRALFAPIGITTERWIVSPHDGLAHAGGGLNLRAVDLARIGQLVLHQGRWKDVQVLPAEWIQASTAVITTSVFRFGGEPQDYGFLWYSMPLTPGSGRAFHDRIIAASGNMTQWLLVVPRYDLVMVVTGRGNASFPAPIDLLRRQVLAAVRA